MRLMVSRLKVLPAEVKARSVQGRGDATGGEGRAPCVLAGPRP
jgi:hypothetical protein